MERHLVDSLQIQDLDLEIPSRILDLGTGGGFPGLILALLYPDAEVVLLDSVGKKLTAVGQIAQMSGITNITLLHGRAEELAHDRAHREQYDLLVTRACAQWPTLLELAVGFVPQGGQICTWRSGVEDERHNLQLANAYGLVRTQSHDYALSDERPRTLWLFTQQRSISSALPRAVGEPKRQPLTASQVGLLLR